eukprot:scaffold298903_cov32-Tisochrysis_lutea.AAC.5
MHTAQGECSALARAAVVALHGKAVPSTRVHTCGVRPCLGAYAYLSSVPMICCGDLTVERNGRIDEP